jgi:sugar phosphate isomerase/epimerase
MEALIQRFGNTHFGAWHDIGHGRIRQNLGFINQERWLQKIQDYLVGMHIHDVAPPAYDHLMPPEGEVDFDRLKPYASEGVIRVMEPSPRATPEEVARGRQVIQSAWA